ncbi:MAG TPA: ABC transporter substrate-binding protein [Acetobacteraceae bacterium]|jgi:galactofuranose transport system substrate-binding protein|nr:ABC transporter substrate-binding protein [Acetobacteraceae bacterium]
MRWHRMVAAGLLMLLAAGAARAETVGFAQVGSESDWRTAFSADMKAEAARRGIKLLFSNADNNPARQRQQVQDFIAAHVDAIVIAPVVVTGWTDTLKAVKAAGIPVFIADRAVDADPGLFIARIAADFNLEGRLAAAWLAQASRGSCEIVELLGTEGSEPAIQRHKGFLAVAAQFPNMRIVRSEGGDFTTEGGAKAMQDLIGATNGLKGICAVWSHNDNMLLGAIKAMRAAGLHPGHDQLMLSVDGVPDIYPALAAGDANMSVELKSDIGKYIYDVVQGYLGGRRDYPKWVVIPSDLHTQADADTMQRVSR